MKQLFCLMMLIGMFSFTGFSTTSDLTKNSDIAFTIDNDVGIDLAIQVEKNISFDALHVETQRLNSLFFITDTESFYPELQEDYINHFKRKEEPPSTNNYILTNYRSPRDNL